MAGARTRQGKRWWEINSDQLDKNCYLPSPAEIRMAAARIRLSWSPTTRLDRLRHDFRPISALVHAASDPPRKPSHVSSDDRVNP